MSTTVQEWRQSHQAFVLQVQKFDEKVRNFALPEEELDKIYAIVKHETKRLKELTDTAINRQTQIDNKRWCGLSRKSLWKLGTLNGLSKFFTISGGAVAIISENTTAKWVALSVAAIAEILDTTSTLYSYKINLDNEEIAQLSKLDKQGVEHAKTFKKFLKKLKKINKIQEEILKTNLTCKQEIVPHQVVINIDLNTSTLDQQIRSCLHDYEELPNCYRKEEVYCKIISHLIQNLPPKDPLRVGLSEFEPCAEIENFNNQVDCNLPVRYLPDFKNQTSSSSFSENKEHKWSVEEQNKYAETPTITDEVESRKQFEKRLIYYKHSVMDRFGLKRDISFFETPHGWRVESKDGEQKICNNKEFDNYSEKESISSGLH